LNNRGLLEPGWPRNSKAPSDQGHARDLSGSDVPHSRVSDGSPRVCGQAGRDFNEEFVSICAHYGLEPKAIQIDSPEEKGDVEASNGHRKRRLPAEALSGLLHCFRLPTVASIWEESVARAEQENWGYRRLLQHLFESEAQDRRERKMTRLLVAAIPAPSFRGQ
jgi:hypothetical protein